MNASFKEKQQKWHQQYRKRWLSLSIYMYRRSVWLRRLYSEKTTCFQYPMKQNAHNNKCKTYPWVKPDNTTAEMVKLKL